VKSLQPKNKLILLKKKRNFMKNLQNFGVLEMNAEEIRETIGGWNWSKVGENFGYVVGRLVTNFAEGILPW
jgi:hypothetical protein